jgi:hypothetical protein
VIETVERNAARKSGLITVGCGTFIRGAAEMLDEVLAEADARAE